MRRRRRRFDDEFDDTDGFAGDGTRSLRRRGTPPGRRGPERHELEGHGANRHDADRHDADRHDIGASGSAADDPLHPDTGHPGRGPDDRPTDGRHTDGRDPYDRDPGDRDPGDRDPDAPPEGDRWSTWTAVAAGEKGPRPWPDWLVTDDGAVDRELGVLKTGKEADVHLVERGVPGSDRSVLLAAKRYRSGEHRMFHRDAGYLEGRRVRRSREMRAMANRTAFGRDVISVQWAGAEFAVLARLHVAGVAVPYPVQCLGTELLMEFVGEPDGTAAPRLAQCRPAPDERDDLWRQLGDALGVLADLGLTHGDLSAYNLLAHRGRLVLIDLPQAVDVLGNPQGPSYLDRDVQRIGEWFVAHGLPEAEPDRLRGELRERAGLPAG